VSEKRDLGALSAACIKGQQMDRAIRGKLAREIRHGRVVAMQDLARWARARDPEEFDDDAAARRFVDEIARDWAARGRWRPKK